MTNPSDLSDYALKRRRLQTVLDEKGADALVLTSPGALGWLLGGARVQVSLVGDPVLAAVLRRDGEDVIPVFSNERGRLEADELAPGLPLASVRWDDPLLGPAVIGTLGSAGLVLAESDVAAELQAVRASLTPDETMRYRRLCHEVAVLLSGVLTDVRPEHTERRVAGRLAGSLVDLGCDPLVILVAGSGRLHHRHPLPTDERIGDRAMVVVCARREGLIANVTRWIRFTSATDADDERERRLLRVERAFLDATRPGAVLSEVFATGIAAYAANGFAEDEWTRHHQGGPTGYNGRDPRATASTVNRVVENQAFAWNPNVPGAKIEDTVLVTSGGVEPLSVDPAWPTVDVEGLARPAEREQ